MKEITSIWYKQNLNSKVLFIVKYKLFLKMKQNIFLLIFILHFSLLYGQEKYSYPFEKISKIDTVYNKDKIDDLINNSNLFEGTFFIGYYDYENNRTPTFFKLEKDYCLSFDLDFEYNVSYTVIGQSENKQYVFVSGEGSYSARQTGFVSKYLHVLDLKNNAFLNLQYYSLIIYWEPDTNSYEEFNTIKEYTVNSSKISIVENGLSVINDFFTISDDLNRDYDIIQSGEYEFDEFQLRKTKYYDSESMRFKPLKYIGNIALGMTLEDFKTIYPMAVFVEKENIYATCADEDIKGFEIWDDNELLGYVSNSLNDNMISDFIVISSKFNFGQINTNSSANEVLMLYPNSNVRLDLLTDWEHIYIQELNMELGFKTDENNRIGIYQNETFIKLKNGKTKVDFIQIY